MGGQRGRVMVPRRSHGGRGVLKQRFSICFNRTHNRHGTLWSERFNSTLLE
jgi:hypothetical protein